MANFIITQGRSIRVNKNIYKPGQESDVSAVWVKMSAAQRKQSQYSVARDGAVAFKDAPANPQTGKVDYTPVPYAPVVVNAAPQPEPQEPVAPQGGQEAQLEPQAAQAAQEAQPGTQGPTEAAEATAEEV